MKIIFLTFGPISKRPGHLARIISVLKEMSHDNEITVVCLGSEADNEKTMNYYSKVKFLHLPIQFKGWEIDNLDASVRRITNIVKNNKPEIVIMLMEVWDLIEQLNIKLKGISKFAVLVHAMPFLTSPLQPSKNFKVDVEKQLQDGIENFKATYINKHYKQARKILRKTNIITCNKTISFYLKNYFPELIISEIQAEVRLENRFNSQQSTRNKIFDFLYMARAEKGKGVEYLHTILTETSYLLKRKVSIALGVRTDDTFSKKTLENLKRRECEGNYEIKFCSWMNEEVKNNIISKCSVFLYPSHYDNFPGVVTEALAFGLPVVAWKTLWSTLNYTTLEFVKMAKLFDYNEFSKYATELLINRNKYSRQVIDYINTLPDPKMIAELDLHVYQSIINSNEKN